MLNKLEFNNLVMTHKNEIRKARIQLIQKLVHKLRRLKEQKEKQTLSQSPEHVNKLEEKITKITETMNHIKQLKGVHLIKKVLLLDKSPMSYITNASSTPDELSAAMLALNKIMASLIKTFKSTLELEDTTNPKWKIELSQISKKKKKLIDSNKREMKQISTKKHKSKSRRNKAKPSTLINDSADNNLTISDECKHVKVKTEDKINEINVSQISETDKSDEAKKLQINPFKKYNENSDNLNDEEEVFVEDPFFVTELGNNYLSTAKQKTLSLEETDEIRNTLKKHTTKRQFENNYKENQRKYNNRNCIITNKVDNIHPSWAAKQKPMMANFKGKKITFDQENYMEDKKELEIKSSGQNKSIVVDNSTKDLHPSWAAKQKLKPTIAAFQGKKIIFSDNDDDDNK